MRRLFILLLALLAMGAKAYAYGQKIIYDKPDFILHIAPEDSNDGFGISKAFGRFNNDNYDDLVVLAPHYHNAKGEKVGKAYIYYGTSFGIDTTAHLEIEGIYKCDEDVWGLDRLGIGDYNNDGFDDLALGCQWYKRYSSSTAKGYAMIISADSDGSGLNLGNYIEFLGYTLWGRLTWGGIGTADINGDKIDDLILNAGEDGNSYEGKIYVYYGGKQFDNLYDKVLQNYSGRTLLGYYSSGDVNNDGFDDILGWDTRSWNASTIGIHLWLGKINMEQYPTYSKLFPYKHLKNIGDLNNNLFSDIIISSSYNPYQMDPNVSPNILIIKGSANFDFNNEIEIHLYGHHSYISSIHDVNKDGINDIFVDIRNKDEHGTTHVFSGDETKYVDISDTLLQFIDSDPSYGLSVTSVIPADMNGDGEYEYYTNSQMKPYKNVIFIYNANFPALALTIPNTPGTEWKTGKEYTINWDSKGNVGPTVKLELFKGSQLHRIIAENTDNDGAHKWTVPPELQTGSDFKIKISAVLDPTIYDFNDHFFTITQVPNLKITYPDSAGIVWLWGETYKIQWNSWGGVGGYVKLELYENNNYVKIINNSAPNTGYWREKISPEDSLSGNNFKIKITAVDHNNVVDFSDDSFTIRPPVVNIETKSCPILTNKLYPCYPNPFNATTKISYEILKTAPVEIKIYDLLGKEVKTWVQSEQAPGHYEIVWAGTDNYNKSLPSGIFLLELRAGDLVQRQKITLLK